MPGCIFQRSVLTYSCIRLYILEEHKQLGILHCNIFLLTLCDSVVLLGSHGMSKLQTWVDWIILQFGKVIEIGIFAIDLLGVLHPVVKWNAFVWCSYQFHQLYHHVKCMFLFALPNLVHGLYFLSNVRTMTLSSLLNSNPSAENSSPDF